MKVLRALFLFVAVLSAFILTGCGGGDNGGGATPPATVDVTGNWNVYNTVNGTPGEQGPSLFTFTQTGNSISGTDVAEGGQITGSLSGLNITMTITYTDFTTTATGTVSADATTMSGTWTNTEGESGTWRATKLQPAAVDITGCWNVYNTVNGTPGEQGPSLFTFTQTGNSISGTDVAEGVQVTGSLSGLNITISEIFTDFTSTATGTVSADGTTMSSGTWTNTEGESGTWRATNGTCAYSISPTTQSFGSTGGTGSVSVTTQNGGNWTVTSNVSWITITSAISGSGNGTVTYSVAANTGTGSRTGTMTIAGQTFTVTQAGSSGGVCAAYYMTCCETNNGIQVVGFPVPYPSCLCPPGTHDSGVIDNITPGGPYRICSCDGC